MNNMPLLQTENRDGLLIVTMSRGKANALNADLVNELTGAVTVAKGEDVRGVALACDVRVMAEGPFRFALNEINLGVALSPNVIRMAVDAVGPRHARELFL